MLSRTGITTSTLALTLTLAASASAESRDHIRDAADSLVSIDANAHMRDAADSLVTTTTSAGRRGSLAAPDQIDRIAPVPAGAQPIGDPVGDGVDPIELGLGAAGMVLVSLGAGTFVVRRRRLAHRVRVPA